MRRAALLEPVLRRLILWVLVLGSCVAALTVGIVGFGRGWQGLLHPAYAVMMLAFVTLIPLMRARVTYRFRALGVVVAMTLMTLASMLVFGLPPASVLAATLVNVIAGVFLGRFALLATTVVTIGGVLAVGGMLETGVVTALDPAFVPAGFGVWLRGAGEVALVGGSVAALVLLLMDMVEKQQAALAERRRLEMLGQLAGGVAHDFNNALQVISGNAYLLSTKADPDVRESVALIREATDRASRMTRQLLALGRRDIWTPTDLKLGDAVTGWVRTIARLTPSDVTLSARVQGQPRIHADPAAVEQIVLNLVLNAREALTGPGTVRVEVDHCEPTPDAPAGVARVQVIDDGPGMPADVQRRLFDPFFTTKGPSGTGLGLALVKAATDRSGGSIDVTSVLGKGTTFTVTWPCVEGVEEGQATHSPAHAASDVAAGSSEADDQLVLYAEDDPAIRGVMVRCLSQLGLSVVAASDGDSALALIQEHGPRIRVLCTDAVMPGAPLNTFVGRYRELAPRGRVIVCSGHVEEELFRRRLGVDHDIVLLHKPVEPDELGTRVRGLLSDEGQ